MPSPDKINELLKNTNCPKCADNDVHYIIYGHYAKGGEDFWKQRCKVVFAGINHGPELYYCPKCKHSF